ncbi:MAG: ArsR/SmtB family transcription factor [Candidatus Thorarchaeota archaeon]
MPRNSRTQSSSCVTVPDSRPCCQTDAARLEVIDHFRKNEEFFNVFTAPIRVGVVFLLLRLGTACVCEIQYALSATSQPLVSHHLRAMKEAGWLKSERRGRWMYYSLSEKMRDQIMSFLGTTVGE